MAKKKKRKADDAGATMDLPMTPMIDVVFQLLIFFLCSLKFKEVEGKLESTLPKDKGLFSEATPQPEINEVRIKMKFDKNKKTTAISTGFQGKEPVGEVVSSTSATRDITATRNATVFATLRDRVAVLYKQVGSSKDPTKPVPVIIEATGDTPYEHVIAAMNACKEVNITTIEFAANPEHQEEKWFKDLMRMNKPGK